LDEGQHVAVDAVTGKKGIGDGFPLTFGDAQPPGDVAPVLFLGQQADGGLFGGFAAENELVHFSVGHAKALA